MPTDPDDRIPRLLELVDLAVDNATLDDLYSVLEQAITSSSRRIESPSGNGDEWWQEAVRDHEGGQNEQLLGLAFLAAQLFITTVTKRLKAVSDACHLSFVTDDRWPYGLMNAEIERINAVANYWKHHEQWSTRLEPEDEYEMREVWDHTEMERMEKKRHIRQKETAEIVESIGMSPYGNLFIAAEAFGVTEFKDLSPIRNKLRDWADRLLKKAKSEVAALESDMTL